MHHKDHIFMKTLSILIISLWSLVSVAEPSTNLNRQQSLLGLTAEIIKNRIDIGCNSRLEIIAISDAMINHAQAVLKKPEKIVKRWKDLGDRNVSGSCYHGGVDLNSECVIGKVIETLDDIYAFKKDDFMIDFQ